MTENKKVNPMKKLFLEKITVNICVGNDKQGMVKAEKLLNKLTNKKPVQNTAKKRLAAWQIRSGLPIGYKVTLRNEEAKKFLKWLLESKGNIINKKSLDTYGNFSVGFQEYLELNSMKYDADIGIMGFEAMATFGRKGFRIKKRNIRPAKIPLRHKVNKKEVMEILEKDYNVRLK